MPTVKANGKILQLGPDAIHAHGEWIVSALGRPWPCAIHWFRRLFFCCEVCAIRLDTPGPILPASGPGRVRVFADEHLWLPERHGPVPDDMM